MDSLMQQMMSDPNTMQSLLSPEMMNIFRQNMEQNPQLVQQVGVNVMESNPFVANNPQLAEQLRAQLPNMMNLTIRREAPAIARFDNKLLIGVKNNSKITMHVLYMFTGMPGADIGVSATPIGVQNPTTQTRGTGSTAAANLDPNAFNILNNMFAGMSTGEGGTSILVKMRKKKYFGKCTFISSDISIYFCLQSENPEEVYAAQLEQLAGMGFNNRAQNIAALRASFGDLNAAVERLLNSP
uniref:UBA domain-containing protein n=1 Tax=Heterorhabditis bacteriophora TaxID=37862 RepID=A0A1I7WX38_HETBA